MGTALRIVLGIVFGIVYLFLQYFLAVCAWTGVYFATRAIRRLTHFDDAYCYAITIPLAFMGYVAVQYFAFFRTLDINPLLLLVVLSAITCVDVGVLICTRWQGSKKALQRESEEPVTEEMVSRYIASFSDEPKRFLATYDAEQKQKAFVRAIDGYARRVYMEPHEAYDVILSEVRNMIDDGRL